MNTRYHAATSRPVLFWSLALLVLAVSWLIRFWFVAEGVWNPGVGFGLPLPIWATYCLSAVFLVILMVWGHTRKSSSLFGAGCAIAFGGGLANLIDRLLHDGRVLDYIPFLNRGYFNLADVAVSVGLGLVVISLVVQSHDH